MMLGLGLALTGCASRRPRPGMPGDLWTGKGNGWQRSSEPMPSAPAASEPTVSVSTSVLPRSQWTARGPILSQTEPMNTVTRITLHHDGMPPALLRTKADVASRLEVIRRAHVEHRGWADIGYHYIVDPSGRVWEGRPVSRQGAHVKDLNPNNVGVLVLGNFEEQRPTTEALAAIGQFVRSLMSRHRVPLTRVVTHQELASTVCPGRNLQPQIVRMRSAGGVLAG